jgi:hypothetical protein
MDIIASYHALTGAIVDLFGGSETLAHVNVGMAVYLGLQVLLRTRRGSWRALEILFAFAVANEVLERLHSGDWRMVNTLGDLAAVMAWPVAAYAVSRFRRHRWAADQLRTAQAFPWLMSWKAAQRERSRAKA